MSYNLNSYQRKNRQKARVRLYIQLAFLLTAAVTGGFGYHLGEQQMAARVNQTQSEAATLTEERDTLHKQVVDLQAADLVNRQKIADLEAHYRKMIPNETFEGLVSLMRDKVAAGVTLERMATILAAAGNPRHCTRAESKRFMLSTSLNEGNNNSATFANGLITIRGEGQTATSVDGNPEAWYDPTKPVSIKFHLIGGRVSVAEGMLPLQHAVIDDATEHRFTIESGARGFVLVTGDTCAYPGEASPVTIPGITPPPPAEGTASDLESLPAAPPLLPTE